MGGDVREMKREDEGEEKGCWDICCSKSC
jgi:hypothetical protein